MSLNQQGQGPAIGRRQRWRHARGAAAALLAGAVAIVCVFVLLPLPVSTRAAVRDITLVTRNMAFYVEGDPTPNPTIRLAPGEEVRFVLRNLDPGIAHNLAIEGWGIETHRLAADGSATLRVRAPDRPTRQTYVCAPHRQMMFGIIEVARDERLR